MKLLFDIGHPADYHLFKNTLNHFKAIGDEILIVVRDREGMVSELLQGKSESYTLLGENAPGIINKLIGLLKYDLKLLRAATRFNPDVFISLGSPYSGHVSFMLRKPHIAFADTESSKIVQLLISPPFTRHLIIPSWSFQNIAFRNYLRINSYKELAYLHPKYFKPDPKVLGEANLEKDEKFVIVRFSAYDAIHDFGIKALSRTSKRRLIFELSRHARILISSEIELESDLKPFMLKINPSRMHDLLSFSSLFVGEGATMAAESAMLGIPSVFINPSKLGCIEDLEKQGLLIQFRNGNMLIGEIIEYCENILKNNDVRNKRKALKEKMLENREDITAILIREIENLRISLDN